MPFIAAGALLAAVMFASAKLLAQFTASAVKQDLYFFAAEELLGLSTERAVLFYRGLEDGFWHLFNQFSGGYYKGAYITDGGTVAAFEFHFPVLALLMYLVFWVSLSFFLLKMFYVRKRGWGIQQLAAATVVMYLVFSILYVLGLAFTKPEGRIESGFLVERLALHIPFLQVLLTLLAVFVLSACIVFVPWRKAAALRNALLALGFFYVVMAGALMLPGNMNGQERDPLRLALIGNDVLQQQLLAVGGTWSAEGERLYRLAGLPGPFGINWFTGVSAEGAEDQEAIAAIGKSIRINWVPAALLLIYLYAVSRLRSASWTVIGVSGLVLAGLSALAAEYVTIRIRVDWPLSESVMDERLGFHWLQAGAAGLAAAAVCFAIAALIPRLIQAGASRKEGVQA